MLKIPNNGQQTVRRQFGVRFAEPLLFCTPDDGPFPLILASGDPRVTSLQGHLRNYNKQVLEGAGTKYSIVLDVGIRPLRHVLPSSMHGNVATDNESKEIRQAEVFTPTQYRA